MVVKYMHIESNKRIQQSRMSVNKMDSIIQNSKPSPENQTKKGDQKDLCNGNISTHYRYSQKLVTHQLGPWVVTGVPLK